MEDYQILVNNLQLFQNSLRSHGIHYSNIDVLINESKEIILIILSDLKGRNINLIKTLNTRLIERLRLLTKESIPSLNEIIKIWVTSPTGRTILNLNRIQPTPIPRWTNWYQERELHAIHGLMFLSGN